MSRLLLVMLLVSQCTPDRLGEASGKVKAKGLDARQLRGDNQRMVMTNQQVAGVLDEIGDILEIQGENRFRVVSYRRGAESVRSLQRDINQVWQAGELETIPGVGGA